MVLSWPGPQALVLPFSGGGSRGSLVLNLTSRSRALPTTCGQWRPAAALGGAREMARGSAKAGAPQA